MGLHIQFRALRSRNSDTARRGSWLAVGLQAADLSQVQMLCLGSPLRWQSCIVYRGVTYGAHVGLYWISPLGSARLYWSLYSVQGFKALAAQARGAGCA